MRRTTLVSLISLSLALFVGATSPPLGGPQTATQTKIAAMPGPLDGTSRPEAGTIADVAALEMALPLLVADPAPAVASTWLISNVPFRTQKDEDRFEGSNCGPAALAMVLGAVGIDRSNADLRFLTHTYQGTLGRRGGTALEHIASVASDLGLEPNGLYDGDDFRQWSLRDVRAAILAGQPVIPLVKYRLLPGHRDSGVRFDHYLVIYGMDGDEFLYHDPIYAVPEEGGARWIDGADLDRAMAAASITRQAASFGPGRLSRSVPAV